MAVFGFQKKIKVSLIEFYKTGKILKLMLRLTIGILRVKDFISFLKFCGSFNRIF